MTTSIPPPRPLDVDVLTIPEFADVAEVSKKAVEQWRLRLNGFPAPDDHIGMSPVWRLERVTAWLKANNRSVNVGLWRQKRAAGGYRRPAHRSK